MATLSGIVVGMTTSAATLSAPTATSPAETAERPDPRPGLWHAIDGAATVIAGVPGSAMGLATPCPDFTVRLLIGHMLGGLGRIAGAGRGEDVTVLRDTSQIPDDALADEWAATGAQTREAWSDPRKLARPTVLPFATLPGGAAVGIYTAEVLAHTWDLARATGQVPGFDEAVVEATLAGSHHGLPAQPRGGEIPFGPVVATAPEAPALDRLAAWQGRDPAWAPAA